jgi:phosphoglycerate dehydrogenase-like enzyme
MALWKTGSWLVSISHGGVINDLDLSDGLAKGLPAGAIVDCFETEPLPDNSELWSLAILSPHLSWYSPESTNRRVETFRARLKEWQGT